MTAPVTPARIAVATEHGIHNAATAAIACRDAGLPFYVACALLEKESGGRNVYGHDKGGVLSGYLGRVNRSNFLAFHHEVVKRGNTSNGVGPCQITYAGPRRADGTRDGGYFRQMFERDLLPWEPLDNMFFGFGILAGHYAKSRSWVTAGCLYNGSLDYGIDLGRKITVWRERMRSAV